PADPMRGLAHLKRSTMVSKAWMPNARPQCRCQAPQPRSGAPLGAGLDSGTPDAAQSALPSIALPCSAPPQMILHRGRSTHGTSASVSNLHQLDGRDHVRYLRSFGEPIPIGSLRLVTHLRHSSKRESYFI